VLVDIVEGYGTLTGLLHNIEEGECAYATVTAKGPAKVWLIPGDEFRSKISANPAFALEMMNAMAHELRNTSKVTRALAKTMSKASPEAEAGGNILRVLCYDTTSWVSNGFNPAVESFNKGQGVGGLHILMDFTPERLGPKSAAYAGGYEAICTFVNDVADSETMQTLSMLGVKMIAQRAAGFDRIDTKAALAYGMTVARVPAYSPYAVAEMGISLLMAVNRKIAKANSRVKMANFSLDEGLMGMDIHGKTVGVMGTGKIGQILCNIIKGFGANLICFDIFESDVVKDLGGKYVTKDELYAQSDVIFLMMPLLPPTRHTINDSVLPKLKKGVLLINTSRGGLVDTKALLKGLSEGIIAGVGMDVYENEADYFFQDWSAQNIPDPVLVALLGNNNVILTAHQAFFTKEAVDKIVATTIENMDNYSKGMRGTSHPNNCIPVPK
jgi:D-lactate dehydrogenase